jgi:hypothetical protein
MNTVWRFLTKFASIIVGPLHCFDRVIFKGHLAMAAPSELERFVDYVLKMRRADFINDLAPQWSQRLVDHAQVVARKAGRTYLYRNGSFKRALGPATPPRTAHRIGPRRHPLHSRNL